MIIIQNWFGDTAIGSVRNKRQIWFEIEKFFSNMFAELRWYVVEGVNDVLYENSFISFE